MRRPAKGNKKRRSVAKPSSKSNTSRSNIRNGEGTQLNSNASDDPTHREYGIPREAFGVTEVDRYGHQPQSLSYQENIPSLNIIQKNFIPMLQMRPEQMAGALGSQRFLMSEANPYYVLQQSVGLISPEGSLINQNAYNLNDWMTLQNNLQPHALNRESLRASGGSFPVPEQTMTAVEQEWLQRQYMMNPYNHRP